MKRFLLGVILVVLAAGCSNKEKQEISGAANNVKKAVKAATSDDGKAKLVKFLQEFQNGNIDACLSIGIDQNYITQKATESCSSSPEFKKQDCIKSSIEGSLKYLKESYLEAKDFRTVLPKTATYEIIESKPYPPEHVAHYVRVKYASKEDSFNYKNQKNPFPDLQRDKKEDFYKEVVLYMAYFYEDGRITFGTGNGGNLIADSKYW